jgi:hypothetical protein
MKDLVEQRGGGGAIALDRQRHAATPFNTIKMMHAIICGDGPITIEVGKPQVRMSRCLILNNEGAVS